ncbi:hypothetical protein CP532_2493 [Ophiocordyceps camponoti-leonardi (nom. inval.)]|nr:hypothetical protein CP532_2493 [Ophiocordyceps camponoti-leonardi (nom. inval.)]
MGLPLFVASVESDLTSKAASKATNASPSRSGIRRLSRADSRERRNAIRTASVRIFGHRPLPRPSHSHDGLLPWVEAPDETDRNAPSSRPQPTSSAETREARETRWQRVVADQRDTRQFEDQMASLFGSNWRERGSERLSSQRDAGPRDTTDRSGLMEARSSRTRRAQVVSNNAGCISKVVGLTLLQVAPVSSRLAGDADRARAPRGSPPPNDRSSTGTDMPPPGSYSAVAIMTRASGPRYQSSLLRDSNGVRRPPLGRHAFAVDGLGDRDRSLSPEVWDTLLTTLTPDPQPPSAGSSFSSLTQHPEWTPPNRSTPDALDEAVADAQCDSCDHSDTSMEEEDENADLRATRPHRPQLREPHRRISPFNLSGPTSAERGALFSWAIPAGSAPRARGDSNDDAMVRSVPLARLLNGGAEPWASQGSPGDEASEEEGGSSGRRQANNNNSNNSGDSSAQTVTLSSEEDWSGMRRIVSSLARREDIPDEWWAEVGLSRTLRRDFAQRP